MDTQNLNPNQQANPQFNQNGQPNPYYQNQGYKTEKKGHGEAVAAAAIGTAAGAGGAVLAGTLLNDVDAQNLDEQLAKAEENLEQAKQELEESSQTEDPVTREIHNHIHVVDRVVPPPPPPIRPVNPVVPEEINVNVGVAPGGDTSNPGFIETEGSTAFVSGSSNEFFADNGNDGNVVVENDGVSFGEELVSSEETPSEVRLTPVEITEIPTDSGEMQQAIAMVDASGNRIYLVDPDGNGFYNHVVDASGNVVDLDHQESYPVNLTLTDAQHIIESNGGYINGGIAQTDPIGENPDVDIINTDGSSPVENSDLAQNTDSVGQDYSSEYQVTDEELYNQIFGGDLDDSNDMAVYDVQDYDMERQMTYESANEGDTSDFDAAAQARVQAYNTSIAGDTADYNAVTQETAQAYDTPTAGDTADYNAVTQETAQAYDTPTAGDTADYNAVTQETAQAYDTPTAGDTADYSSEVYDTAQASYDTVDTTDTADYSYTPEPEPDYTASVDVPTDDFAVDMIDTDA